MRIESVTAHAFGPFQGESRELGEGMTVICGPNESGKSSWHASLYAGLCGIRRRAGQRTEDREFRDRHRPWDGQEWRVSTVVSLADGRRVRLSHDLDGRVNCQALDADLGRDYSEEIIFEGAPDGSRWLGLDRKTFLSTACIRQDDIRSVTEKAGALQDHLQRAAATAGADATAAAAIERIETFKTESVGLNRRNSSRPLPAAVARLAQTEGQLEHAKAQHREYLQLQGQIEIDQDSLAAAESLLQAAQAARARHQANSMRRQANRALELAALHPTEPVEPSELRERVQTVRTAVSIFDNKPNPVSVGSPTSAELLNQIEVLPQMPDGDRRPHPGVSAAASSYGAAQSVLEQHQSRKPPEPEDGDGGGLLPDELRRLSEQLTLEGPAVDPILEERIRRAQTRLDELRQPETRQRAGKPVSPFLLPLVMVFRLLALLLRPLLGGHKTGPDYAAIARETEELRQAETELGEQRFQLESVRKAREAAANTATEFGLPTDAPKLMELAASAERQNDARASLARWQEEDHRLRETHSSVAEALGLALESRNVPTFGGELLAAVENYVQECEQRDRQVRLAEQRPVIEQALADKRAQEEAAADAAGKRAEAAGTLREAAGAIGVYADTEEELLRDLRRWIAEAAQLIPEQEEAQDQWREFQALLAGHSVEELEASAENSEHEAERLANASDDESIRQAESAGDLDRLIEGRRSDADEARTRLATTRGQFDQFSGSMPSVSEAEEELAKAKAELERVTDLGKTLDKTLELLKAAQDRVHRDLAPRLRNDLRPWLSAVTKGRYQDLLVDVQTLNVKVSGDGVSWRDANLLSHGTAEQIYLLLRVVMTRYLTKPGETCPLILDDITVHCDPRPPSRNSIPPLRN